MCGSRLHINLTAGLCLIVSVDLSHFTSHLLLVMLFALVFHPVNANHLLSYEFCEFHFFPELICILIRSDFLGHCDIYVLMLSAYTELNLNKDQIKKTLTSSLCVCVCLSVSPSTGLCHPSSWTAVRILRGPLHWRNQIWRKVLESMMA